MHANLYSYIYTYLLKIGELLNVGRGRESRLTNALQVVTGGNGTATAIVHERNAGAFHFTHTTGGGHTHVRSVHDQDTAIVGDVGRHGAKPSVAGKGKAGQATEIEVLAVHLDEIAFQLAGQFIAAQ